VSDRRPDLDFFTSVKAKELTFGRVPERKVRYYGEPDHETEVEVERENIPEEPEEGVTYRDVEVSWSVAQRIVHPADDEEEWKAEFESGAGESSGGGSKR
jgi:hypothetical protein